MLAEIAILFSLILLNGFFALSEMAIVSSRKARLKHEADKGKKAYRRALETAEKPARFLSTIQVVITLIGTLAGAFGGATVAKGIESGLASIPGLAASATPISMGIVVVCTTFVSVILGELVPKNLALARPEPIAAAVIGPIRFISIVFSPLIRLLSWTTEFIVGFIGAKSQAEPEVTEEEIRVLIAQGAETGIFAAKEKELVEGVLSLDDRRVAGLMTPRADIVWIDLNEGDEEAKRIVLENARYGFLPAAEASLDRIVGMLPVKEALASIAAGGLAGLRSLLRKTVFVAESASALKALSAIKAGDVKTALILDEYGAVAGLVALSDLFGAMVGRIPRTGDPDEPKIVKRAEGNYLVDGSLPIDRFAEGLHLDMDLVSGDYSTVAGLVLDAFGSIPKEGDRREIAGCSIEVMDMDGHRIDKLLVTVLPREEE